MKYFITLAILLQFCAMRGQLCLTPASLYSSYNGANSIAQDDFNNDNIIDLATTNVPSSSTFPCAISVLTGNGNGTFGAALNFTFNPGTYFKTICTSDFNNDGNLDLVAAAGTAQFYILTGNGAGNFTSPQTVTSNSPLDKMISVDFNLDGNKDIAAICTQFNSKKVLLFQGDGAGNFTQLPNIVLSGNTNFLSSADFNNDGNADLVTGYDTLVVLAGNGASSFSIQKTGVGSVILSAICADVNTDGNTDIMAALSNSSLYFFQGNGSALFPTSANLNLPSAGTQFVCEDFDLNSKKDLACLPSNLEMYFGNGFGSFGNNLKYTNPGSAIGELISGDYNGDGRKDIAAALNQSGPNVAVYLNYNSITALNITFSSITCKGLNNGWAKVSVVGSGGPYQYAWTNPLQPVQTTDSASNLPYGVYSVEVTASTACTYSTQVFITEPAKLKADIYNANTTCGSNNNPNAAAGVIGGTAPFSYLWNTAQTSSLLTNVAPGAYAMKVTDQNGCKDSASANLAKSPQFNATFSNVNINSQPSSIMNADFNGDGNTDAVTAYNSGTVMTISMGITGGGFLAPQTFPTGLLNFVPLSNMCAADFNNDGKTDFVIGTIFNKIIFFKGNGNGTFSITPCGTFNGFYKAIAAFDFDGNGTVDIAAINDLAGMQIFSNNGSGVFSLTNTYSPAGGLNSMVIADFTNDGKMDIVCGGNSLALFSGSGNGSFSQAILSSFGSQLIATGDFNNDGKPEIVAVNTSSNSGLVLAENGAGTFTVVSGFTVDPGSNFISCSDMDNDFNNDVIIGYTYQGLMSILPGDGLGNVYSPCKLFTTNNQNYDPYKAVIWDFDMNGKQDVLTVNSGSVQVFLNCTPVAGIKENNNDQVINVYPNPSQGKFKIISELNNGVLRLRDLRGRLIIEKTIYTKESIIDMSQETPGVYILEVSGNNQCLKTRIVLLN